jgi:hypothetical protein
MRPIELSAQELSEECDRKSCTSVFQPFGPWSKLGKAARQLPDRDGPPYSPK